MSVLKQNFYIFAICILTNALVKIRTGKSSTDVASTLAKANDPPVERGFVNEQRFQKNAFC